MLKLYNTLTRKIEEFKPLNDNKVGLYACGPTVYWYAHAGNLKTYIFEDILKRVLRYNGLDVKHVMNITDVGHLTSDSDEGEDKLEKGAAREHKTVWEIARFYTDAFKKDMKLLNIEEPDIWVKATDTIPQQLELIKKLEEKGFTYSIDDGVYFDTGKLEKYGRLWTGAERKELRGRIEENKQKKNPSDFALWKFSPKDEKRQMEWDSPWGKGFPGWHTECVVMSVENLGIPFDIHCGGIDHISVHHTNEIAQAEAVYGELMANYWMHGDFLVSKDGKMSKSKGNIATIEDLQKQGINPLSYRYLCLTSHYRSKLTFSDESIQGAQNSLDNLYKKTVDLFANYSPVKNKSAEAETYKQKFLDFINNDLDMPGALALAWDLVRDKNIIDSEKYELLLDFDKVFGLSIKEVSTNTKRSETETLPAEIMDKVKAREQFRKDKEWDKADEIRKELEQQGWVVEDLGEETILKKA
ncbi:MAG: cysteine--tRNA ligase [Candidatus Paceibacterota bacterium]